MTPRKDYNIYVLFLVLILIHGLGLFNDIFNGDSSLYASISKNIASSHQYYILNSILQSNWIDKPHLGFWIWSIFIQLFGNTSWAFKLPVFLAFLALLRLVYQYTILYYDRKIAWSAVIIIASSLHFFLSTNDVRLDIYLCCFVMGAIYYYHRYIATLEWKYLLMASVMTALAIMSKGIVGLLPIALSMGGQLIFTKRYSLLWRWQWAISFLLIILLIIPVLYALKMQFDYAHEDIILGMKSSNYLQFFFWDSQFGRFQSNLGQLKANGDKSFYVHTLLWALLPWTLLVFRRFFLINYRLKEYGSIVAFTGMFIILSLSRTQLSHHVLILMPFISILTADILHHRPTKETIRYLNYAHYGLLSLLPVAMVVMYYFFTGNFSLLLFLILSIVCIAGFWMRKYRSNSYEKLLFTTAVAGAMIGIFLNLFFYPKILTYQAGKKAAEYVALHYPNKTIHEVYSDRSLLNYYSQNKIIKSEDQSVLHILPNDTLLYYSGEYLIQYMKTHRVSYQIIDSFDEFRTTVITPDFFDYKTRKNALHQQYLFMVYGQNRKDSLASVSSAAP